MKAPILARLCLALTLLFVMATSLPGSAQQPGWQTNAQVITRDKFVYLPALSNGETSPGTPPLASNSLYITTQDLNAIYAEGCKLGQRDYKTPGKQDSVVVLHFGYPRYENGMYGAHLYYPASPATVDQIATMVEQFGNGYWYCVYEDYDSHLRIAVGTSNVKASDPDIYGVTYNHGRAWAQMVNRVNTWFQNTCTRGCDGQVDAVGASDIELAWNSYTETKKWLDGYDSANTYPLYNFGSLDGCPTLANPGAQCGSYSSGYLWSKEQVWYVTWGASPVQPMPEIYLTDGRHAEQWYLMSVYAYQTHNAKMQFVGPMSTYQACLQRGGCSGSGWSIMNTPEKAWKQLYDLLNSDFRTAGETLPYVTDIMWYGESLTSSPGAAVRAVPDQTIPNLKLALQNARLGVEERQSLEEKLSQNEHLAQARNLGKPAKSEPKQTKAQLLVPAQPAQPPQFEDQIIPGSEGILRPWEANIINLWQGQRDGWAYQVLAGSSAVEEGQGVVLMVQSRPDGSHYTQKFYSAPGKTGALRVESIQGTRLILSAENGGQLVFDLTTRSFLAK